MSDLDKIRFEIVQAISNSNRIIHLQELIAMMCQQFEIGMPIEMRQARLDLLLEFYQEQIAPELEELNLHLETARSGLQLPALERGQH